MVTRRSTRASQGENGGAQTEGLDDMEIGEALIPGGLSRLPRQAAKSEAKKDSPLDLADANAAIAAILKTQEAHDKRMMKLERRNRKMERRNRRLKRKVTKKVPLTTIEEIPEEENPFEHLQDDERINIPDTSNEETSDRFPKGSRDVPDHEDSLSEGSSYVDPKHRRNKNQIDEVNIDTRPRISQPQTQNEGRNRGQLALRLCHTLKNRTMTQGDQGIATMNHLSRPRELWKEERRPKPGKMRMNSKPESTDSKQCIEKLHGSRRLRSW
ncbi:uncharacterized protein LOC113325169 [Papaver somniferum]|uniref:uncharacterized protein LOC113325169 n=1 Tax=Papaver somniferum TaxID=3469 RepID=UPI000E6F64FB|nr:uncharacterized protein LOC113325169 [Papaver somniferum]